MIYPTDISQDELNFLRESNAIENVWDERSLTVAIKAWKYIRKKKKLILQDVLYVHKLLMTKHLRPDEVGYWRREPVWIGNREGKPWYVIPELMAQWIIQANKPSLYSNPSEIEREIRETHVWYERIHPFIDGNGRTGRIFMNWQRIRNGLPIDIVWEKEKYKYYAWFSEKEDTDHGLSATGI